MPFVKKVPANPHGGPYKNCITPNSNGRKNFEVGTTWRCDVCGKLWEFTGISEDQRDGTSWDTWKVISEPIKLSPEPWYPAKRRYNSDWDLGLH